MALREELERSGNWLFRRRSYLPLAVVALVLAGMTRFEYPGDQHHLQDVWEAVCLMIAAIGLTIRALVVGFAPPGTSGRNTWAGQVAERLNTTGMYSIVRHPLYLGNLLMWLGLVLMTRSGWLLLVVMLAFWLYYERIAFSEEEFLRRRFGDDFERWAARTPAFFPCLVHWRRPDLPFSVRSVLRREYPGVFAVAALFALLDVVGNQAATGRPTFDSLARAVFLVGLTLFVVLRALKRRTNLLSDRTP